MTNSKINIKIKKTRLVRREISFLRCQRKESTETAARKQIIITNILSESDKVEVTCVHCDQFQVLVKLEKRNTTNVKK